jgi:regulator of replication initiation timing
MFESLTQKLGEVIDEIKKFADLKIDEKETDWIPYVKVGDEIRGVKITEELLSKLAENYNPKDFHVAPLMLGHTKDNEEILTRRWKDDTIPRFGVISKLKFESGTFYLKFSHLADQVREWIKNRLYDGFSWEVTNKLSDKKIPVPYLTGVALLGSTLPAVAGSYLDPSKLAEVKDGNQSETEYYTLIYKNQETNIDPINNITEGEDMEELKELLKSLGERLKALEDKVAGKVEKTEEKPEELKTLETENQKLKERIEEQELAERTHAAIATLGDMKAVPPAIKVNIERLAEIAMANTSGNDKVTFKFAENGKEIEVKPDECIKQLGESLKNFSKLPDLDVAGGGEPAPEGIAKAKKTWGLNKEEK